MALRRIDRATLIIGAAMVLMAAGPMPAAHADSDLVGGIGDIMGGVLSLPMGILSGTMTGPPVIGTIGGAVLGVLNTVTMTTRGLLRLVGVAIPIAAAAAPYLPLFL